MNWQETILKDIQDNRLQAELSFKAGYDASSEDARETDKAFIQDIKKAGREEVVEWIDHYYKSDFFNAHPYFFQVVKEEWQAKLKEWGIE